MIATSSLRLYRQDRLWTLTGTQSLGNISLPFFKTNNFIWKFINLNFALFCNKHCFHRRWSTPLRRSSPTTMRSEKHSRWENKRKVVTCGTYLSYIIAYWPTQYLKKKHLLNLTSFLFIHRWCPKSSNLDTVRWQKCPTELFEVL